MKKPLVLFSLFVMVLRIYGTETIPLFQTEIIVRTPQNIHSLQDIKTLVALCKKYHIATITLLCKQDEDDEFDSGMVFYPSLIAPVAEGYRKTDMVKELLSLAHQAGIKVHAWIPQFHDQVAFYTNSKWPMMAYKNGKIKPYISKEEAYFVNPLHPDVQAYELSIIKEVAENYDFDAITLDWIRFDDYAMDLSNRTRDDFKKVYGYDPVGIDFLHENKQRTEWNSYRSEQIAAYIRQVKEMLFRLKPNLRLGVYILSPAWYELAQDPGKFKQYIDFISPMCYYDDWGYPHNWIYDQKRDDAILPLVKARTGSKMIAPVFDADWDQSVYSEIFVHLKDIRSVVFFHYGKWTEALFQRVYQATKVNQKRP